MTKWLAIVLKKTILLKKGRHEGEEKSHVVQSSRIGTNSNKFHQLHFFSAHSRRRETTGTGTGVKADLHFGSFGRRPKRLTIAHAQHSVATSAVVVLEVEVTSTFPATELLC